MISLLHKIDISCFLYYTIGKDQSETVDIFHRLENRRIYKIVQYKGVLVMDIRVVKTKRSIINSFLEIRSKKAIEKITVKELCEKAEINKSTFYTHFNLCRAGASDTHGLFRQQNKYADRTS